MEIKVDIMDKKKGDYRQVLVTPEVLEEQINPRLKNGSILVGRLDANNMRTIAQGRSVSMQQLEKVVEENRYSELMVRPPITAG